MHPSSQRMSWLYQAQPILLFIFLFFLSIQASAVLAAGAFSTPGPGLIEENKTGLIWQERRSSKMRSPVEVQAYLAQLNQGTYHDWRLPTKWELYDFFMVFDLKNNKGIKVKLEGSYWLKEETGDVYPGSWEQGDQCGTERTFYPTKSGYVRAVRP